MTHIFFSTTPKASLNEQLARLCGLPPLPPFSPAARDFVADFSRRIFALPALRQHPELATLAHWFRASALGQLATRIKDADEEIHAARGLVFHLAPANVDVLFAYAWLMSVLAGNSNVARLSQRPSAQRNALVSILHDMQKEGLHANVLERAFLLTYPHDDSITEAISRHCQARIVWGGDQTVERIRSIPLAPLAVERAFPDRFGVAAFKASKISSLSDPDLEQLAHRFNNDVLWFGQQACSSPRSLFWVGEQSQIASARERFWPAVRKQATQIADEPAALMARITDAHLIAAQCSGVHTNSGLDQYPLDLSAEHAGGAMRELQSGYGLIVECELPLLENLADQLDMRDQTLVEYGFAREELVKLLGMLKNRAIDRIVPVGRALDFHPVWDGTDLLDILCRKITVGGRSQK